MNKPMNKNKKAKKNKVLIIVIIAAIVAVCIVIAIGINKDAELEQTQTEENDTIYGDESLGIDAGVDEALRGYRNIFIFGRDNKDRSDIILIASINKKNNHVKLITTYRDTYMQLREEGETFYIGGKDREFFKCNHAYKKGGLYAEMKELNMNMDLNCHEGLGMDWATIEMLIDGVGGLDVDVTPGMLAFIDSSLISESGMQHLNGKQSVAYLRERKDNTAVQRAERNEAAFVQMFEKANKLSKKEQLELLDNVYARADSNMSKSTMTEILNQLSSFEIESKGGWPYDWHLYWDSDMSFYYFLPETLESNVVRLHKELFEQKDYTASETLKKISKRISNMEPELYRDGRDDFGQ